MSQAIKKPQYTWEQQRKDIQRDVNAFFSTRIEVSPRAMASLQAKDNADWLYCYDEELSGTYEISILECLVKSSPACAVILFKAGVALEHLEFPPTLDVPAPLAEDTLDWIFKGVEEVALVPTAQDVAESKLLKETDILISALQASIQGSEPNGFGGAILKAAGIEEPRHVRGYVPDEDWAKCDNYLTHITSRVKEIATADPSHTLIQFVLYEDEAKTIRLRPFGTTGLSGISIPSPIQEGKRFVYRGGVIQPIETVCRELSDEVLGLFEELINSDSATEADFQRFFETYPFFLTGLDFSRAHPQPILYKDEGGWLIPDFFLEKLSSEWDAILDLKRPFDEMITRRRNRVYFKQHVHDAISQLRYYREWFASPTNRQYFEEVYGIQTFRPKMVIVIGRDHHFHDDVERIRLTEELPLEMWTYDDLYNRARRYLDLCTREPKYQQNGDLRRNNAWQP